LFQKATLHLAGGKTFVVSAMNNGPQRPYIRGAALNGQPFKRTFLSHEEIMKGGEFEFDMTSAPDYQWATAPDSRPSSPMREQQSAAGK
jgi:putative alpha-1,2-mannosidase